MQNYGEQSNYFLTTLDFVNIDGMELLDNAAIVNINVLNPFL